MRHPTEAMRGVRREAAAGLLALIPLGLATKLYRGPAEGWVTGYAGGIVYEVFWVLLLVAVRPKASPVRAALGVLAVTCVLEAAQLWQPPALQAARGTFLGRTLLGSTFSPWDFPHYAVGCLIGGVWARRIRSRRLGPANGEAGR